ncbi:MAG TPA: homoserine O-acetyltransferase [Acidimicrobiia bacterium]|nr:homoserine O-acetyltransferase [Acidimicrobiia bacterium]
MSKSGPGEPVVETRFFDLPDDVLPFKMRSGDLLPEVRLAYELHGEISPERDNVVLLFHALTGSQHVAGLTPSVQGVERWVEENQTGWWEGFVGPGLPVDTDRFAVLCVNYLGGCYGTTGPGSIDPRTGTRYGPDFPPLHLADIVESQLPLLEHLGITRLKAVAGASVGALLSVSLAAHYPDLVENVIVLAGGLAGTTLHRMYNFEQKLAIFNDPNFKGGDYYDGEFPAAGLALARIISHKAFVSIEAIKERARNEILDHPYVTHRVESYFWRQGQKLVIRFDPNSYLRLIDSWSDYDLVEDIGAESYVEALTPCADQAWHVFTIDTDVCFYPEEQAELVAALTEAGVPVEWIQVTSPKGHDSFLTEPHLFEEALRKALA